LAAALTANAKATRSVANQVATAKTARQALAIIGKAKAAQKTGQAIDSAIAKLKQLGYTQGS
jgi:hypothetical protein